MRLRCLLVAMSLVGLAASIGPTDQSTAFAQAPCQAWKAVTSPAIPNAYLTGVAGLSATDAWAVGSNLSTPSQPVILHWNGSTWVSAPAARVDGSLTDVSVDAANDGWAVGPSGDLGSPAMHWDGARWRLVENFSDPVWAVAALSPSDAWAVGFVSIHHWDGVTWTLVEDSGGFLTDVVFVSPDDGWAVGSRSPGVPVARHWDGTAWTEVAVPSPPGATGAVGLEAVAAVSATDVWATGSFDSDLKSLVEHWDGSAWSIVSVAVPAGLGLSGVSAASSTDIWAVGGWRKITLHGDGSNWNPIAFHAPGHSFQGPLRGVAAVSADDVWAVGSYVDGGVTLPLIEHSTGPCP
jgi:hypothetical protein